MSASLFLFLPKRNNSLLDLEKSTLSWVIEDVNQQLSISHGTIADVAVAAAQKMVTVVLAGEDVLYLTAEVPGKNIQQVQQAIPYVLEDSVIDDVDDLYFSIKKNNTAEQDNNYSVSVINKHYFESIIRQLENVGIYADSMIADYFLINDEPILFFDGTRVIYNSSEVKFSSVISNAVPLGEIDSRLKLINCDETNSENITLNKLLEGIDVIEEKCEAQSLLSLIKHRSDNAINLLQGAYKKKKDWSQAGKTWMPVGILFLVWVVIQTGLFVFDYIDLNNKNKQLNVEITKIYKNTFPKSRRVIDARAQMQQKLSELKKRNGQTGRSFSEMLSNSAKIFSQTAGLEIISLRYYDGSLNLEIQIPTLQALDGLKEKLTKEEKYQLEVKNASSENNKVTAQLQIIGEER